VANNQAYYDAATNKAINGFIAKPQLYDFVLMIGSWMEVANALAYCDATTNKAVKTL
jgi:hypothetical protein